MREEYISPEVEIVEFDTEDVITTSNTRSGNDSDVIDGHGKALSACKGTYTEGSGVYRSAVGRCAGQEFSASL